MSQLKRRPVRILGVGLVAATIVTVAAIWMFVVRPDRQMYVIPMTPPGRVSAERAAELEVAVVGDSWVTEKKLDPHLADALAEQGLAADVRSAGQPGAKSRHVAMNWTADRSEEHSFRDLWEGRSVDYVVLVVGVNDAAGHVGSDRYRHHIVQLVEAIKRNGMHPVLVELPEFGIEELPSRSLLSDLKRGLFRVAFDDGETNVIQRYRKELRHAIADRIERGEITLVDFDQVCPDYDERRLMYKDPAHLNEYGSAKLAGAIAASIASTHERRTSPNAHQALRRRLKR